MTSLTLRDIIVVSVLRKRPAEKLPEDALPEFE